MRSRRRSLDYMEASDILPVLLSLGRRRCNTNHFQDLGWPSLHPLQFSPDLMHEILRGWLIFAIQNVVLLQQTEDLCRHFIGKAGREAVADSLDFALPSNFTIFFCRTIT